MPEEIDSVCTSCCDGMPLGNILKMTVVGHNDYIPLMYAKPIRIPCLKLEWMDSMQHLQRVSLRDYNFCLCKVISTPENNELTTETCCTR